MKTNLDKQIEENNVKNSKLESEIKSLKKYKNDFSALIKKFRINLFLKNKIFSKLTFGILRKEFQKEYSEQKKIYKAIKKGHI